MKERNIEKVKTELFFFLLTYFVLTEIFFFFRATPWHMEAPRLEVELEVQLPAYTIATAVQHPSRIFNLHHISWGQCQIFNPLREAKNGICVLMDASWACYR